jgi:hypothetical protein
VDGPADSAEEASAKPSPSGGIHGGKNMAPGVRNPALLSEIMRGSQVRCGRRSRRTADELSEVMGHCL